MKENISQRSRLATFLFCLILGVFGAHRFYVGKVGTGFLQLFTGGGCLIWVMVDLVLILIGDFRDKEGRRVKNWRLSDITSNK